MGDSSGGRKNFQTSPQRAFQTIGRMSADYLIVGQGIAGSVLAWTLHRRGKKVLLVNSPQRPSASLVAAGIFNPLTGKKLVRTWKADQLFPFLKTFYGGVEQELGVRFLHFT